MRHPKTIVQRAGEPWEEKWTVIVASPLTAHVGRFLAVPPRGEDAPRFFPTIAQACDYARAHTPEEATC